MNGLGDILLAASGHPIDHVANELTGELAGSKVRYQSAETESAFAKARKERADAAIAEGKATAIPGLGDLIAAHHSGSPEDRAAIIGGLIAAGGAPDAAAGGANAYDTGNRATQTANITTSIPQVQHNLAAEGKPLADVFAPVGPDMYSNRFLGTDPVRNPTVDSKIAHTQADTSLIHHRDTTPGDFRNAPAGSLPLDPQDVADVSKAQDLGLVPWQLSRAYTSPQMFHLLAETVRHAPPGASAADFHQMQVTTDDYDKGQKSKNVMSLNSTIGHLRDFDEAGVQLGNNNAQPLNALSNALATAAGKPAPTKLNEIANLLSAELETTYVNNGGTEAGREKLHKAFADVNSPEQMKTATDTARETLSERGQALEQNYYAGRGLGNFRTRYLTPETRVMMHQYHPTEETPWYAAQNAATEANTQGASGGASASGRTPGPTAATVATSANPHPVGGNSAAGPGGAGGGGGTGAPIKIANDADYAKVPHGASYIAPDGITRKKP